MFDAKMKILWDMFIIIPAISVALIGAADWLIRKAKRAITEYNESIKEDNNEQV